MERAPAVNLPERRPQKSESFPEDSESGPEHNPPSFLSTSPSVGDTSVSSSEFSPSFSEFSLGCFLRTSEPGFQKTGFGSPVGQGHRDRCPVRPTNGTMARLAQDNGPRCTRTTDANLARFRGAREPRLLKTWFAGVCRDASWSVQGVHLHVFKACARCISGFETRRGLTPPSFRSPNGTRAGREPSRKTPAKVGELPGRLREWP